ncbi:Enolase [uncultured archaeon]|nr:Enolase [uncultured archaeon]
MQIKKVYGEETKDSRGEPTIAVFIETNVGKFSASSPDGKSKGKFEAKSYKKNLQEDIKTLKKFSDYFAEEIIEEFQDLRQVEDIIKEYVGANTLFALEAAILKAIAKEKKKQVWQVINPGAKKVPRFVGNCVGGGKHSQTEKKPDFQEFLLISDLKSARENSESNKKIRNSVGDELKIEDKTFTFKVSDEKGWMTSLNEKEVLDILTRFKLPFGVDVASSSFYSRKKYHYENPKLDRTADEQLFYLSNLIKNYKIFYIEDPFDEEDFENFANLLKTFPNCLIVGDDLTVTNLKRLEKAIKLNSINGIIVKPNQNGSLLQVKEVCELAKKNNIKTVFSHRSGETEENILADLAIGFGADFLKCGITGKEREAKIKRLIEIEKAMK